MARVATSWAAPRASSPVRAGMRKARSRVVPTGLLETSFALSLTVLLSGPPKSTGAGWRPFRSFAHGLVVTHEALLGLAAEV